jgi:hypothetical protein
MSDQEELFGLLGRNRVPFVVIGGHAVNFHGYQRATEDIDIVWIRSAGAEVALSNALLEIDAQYISNEIDPATKIERTCPVTLPYIQTKRLMVLFTKLGFVDFFDYIPGLPQEDVGQLLESSVTSEGIRYASLDWLRQMKRAAGRTKDRLDLENLPE